MWQPTYEQPKVAFNDRASTARQPPVANTQFLAFAITCAATLCIALLAQSVKFIDTNAMKLFITSRIFPFLPTQPLPSSLVCLPLESACFVISFLCFKSQTQLVRMFSCSNCRGEADKNTSTVKIDFEKLVKDGEKENVAPQPPSAAKHSDAVEKQKQEMKEKEELQRREQAEKEKREQQKRDEELQKEKERKKMEEEQRELMRRLAEEQQRQRAEEKRIAEEKRQAELRRQEEERRRQEEERLRAEAEAKAKAEKERKQGKLNSFLTSAGFKEVNEQKKKSGMLSSSFTYPLHVAVKANNLEAVELLLWAGANKALKDSNKQTPSGLASKLNKKDSHKAILTALGE